MTAAVRIRRATVAEVVACNAVVFPLTGPIDDADLEDSAWWVAVRAGVVVGFAGVKVTGDRGYLTRAGVVKEARGAGLQRRLLRVREAYARKMGAKRTYTYVEASNYASASNLAACGYRYDYYEPGADGYAWCWWQKSLDGSKLPHYRAAHAY